MGSRGELDGRGGPPLALGRGGVRGSEFNRLMTGHEPEGLGTVGSDTGVGVLDGGEVDGFAGSDGGLEGDALAESRCDSEGGVVAAVLVGTETGVVGRSELGRSEETAVGRGEDGCGVGRSEVEAEAHAGRGGGRRLEGRGGGELRAEGTSTTSRSASVSSSASSLGGFIMVSRVAKPSLDRARPI